ncbi:hypothetical protein WA158_008217 [Blastocystis sp. Blastoise]
MTESIPLNCYKSYIFHDGIFEKLCHRILNADQNTIAFVYGNPSGELCVFPLDVRSQPIRYGGLGVISSVSTCYIKEGLYNIFVITIDGTMTLLSLTYKRGINTALDSPYIYRFIIEQTISINSKCTCSIALHYGNEKQVIIVLGNNNGLLSAYSYYFKSTLEKPFLSLQLEDSIEYIYPFYDTTLMNTKLLVSLSHLSPVIISLNGSIETLPTLCPCNHNSKSLTTQWIYPVYGKTPKIFVFCSCGMFNINGEEKKLSNPINTIWAAILQRGDLETNNQYSIYDCFIIRHENNSVSFIDQQGNQYSLDIRDIIQCIKTIKLRIENRDEQIVAVFTSNQLILYRGYKKNYSIPKLSPDQIYQLIHQK